MARVEFDNKITTGNLLTIAGGVIAFLLMFGQLREEQARLEGRVVLTERSIEHSNKRIDDQRTQIDRQWEQMSIELRTINSKLDEIQRELGKKQDRESTRPAIR